MEMNKSNNFNKSSMQPVGIFVTNKDPEKGIVVLRQEIDTKSIDIKEYLETLIATINNKLETDVIKNKVSKLLKTGKCFVEDTKIVMHNIDEVYDSTLHLKNIEIDDSSDEPPILYGTINGKEVSILNFRNYYITSGFITYSSSEHRQPKPSKEVYSNLDNIIKQIIWSHYDEYVEVIKDDLDLVKRFKEETIKFYGGR